MNYFQWQNSHKAESECECNCLARSAAFAAGLKQGRRDAIQRSAYLQLVPLLEALLDELITDRIDDEVESITAE